MSQTVAAIRIRRLPIGEIKPHPRNTRTHPKPGSPVWKVLLRSVEHDYFDLLVWNERTGYLVSGHFRLEVMESIGITEIDVSVVDYDEPTHYARMIAANRPLGDWENAILASLAGEIDQAGLDAALAGFDAKALMALVDAPEVEGDDDNAEQLVIFNDADLAAWHRTWLLSLPRYG